MRDRNVPKLRFKGFSDEWEEKKLGDISDITKLAGFEFTQYVQYSDIGNIIALRGLNVKDGNLNLSDVKYIDNSDFSKLKRSKLFINDLLFTYVGTIGDVALVDEDNKYYLAPNVCRIRTYGDNSYFLKTLISSSKFYNKIIIPSITTSSQPALSMENIRLFKVNIPSIGEQEKIVNFFTKIDKIIEKQEEKVSSLEKYKKGIMQKIFSQEIRFKKDEGGEYPEWKVKFIEEIANLEKGFTPDTNNESLWKGDISWLSIAGMNGKYITNGNKNITSNALGERRLVKENTLIMSFKLTIGRLAIVKAPLVTNEAICHFYWKDKGINTEYMYYYLGFINISSFGCRAAKGITLNNESLNSIVVKLPCEQEQKKISEFLCTIDSVFAKEKEKLEALRVLKKGLLQQMFV